MGNSQLKRSHSAAIMPKFFLFLCCLAALSTVALSVDEAADILEGDTRAPCSNGSAIYHVSLTDESHLKGYCRQYDNCTRYCYNSPNCTEHSKAPPNQQVFITAINNTNENHQENNKPIFRCCASSLRLKNCQWKTVKGEITVAKNETISDVKIVHKSDKTMEVKVCLIDEAAGQPTAKTVCYAEVCRSNGYCYGTHVPQSGGPMVFNDDVPYGLLALLSLEALEAIKSACEKLLLPVGVTSISYSKLNPDGKIPIGGSAVATCTAGLSFPTGKNTFETTCTAAKTFAPTVPPCAVVCPKLVDPSPGTFAYSGGTCTGQLCPLGTVATLTCPTGQMSVDVATSACVATTTCASGSVFTPYTTQLSCVRFCAPLTPNAALYSVSYSTSNCAILDKTVATVTCATGKYYPDGTTTRQSTCSNSILAAPTDSCAATCPLPTVEPTTQTVSYSKTAAPNGQLFDGTVATVTCTVATDIFADGSSPLVITCSAGALSKPVSPCVTNCPKLTDPANGVFIYAAGACSSTGRCTIGTTAQFSCNSGYTAVTIAGSVCSVPPIGTCDAATRLFTVDATTTYTCVKTCPPLPLNPTLYTVTYSPSGCPDIYETNEATVTCATDKYYPDGTTTATTTCTNGILSPSTACAPTCPVPTIDATTQAVTYSPALAANGQMLNGAVATVTCQSTATDMFSDKSTTLLITCSAGTLDKPVLPCVITCPELLSVTSRTTVASVSAYSQTAVVIGATSRYTGGTTTIATCAGTLLCGGTPSCTQTCTAGVWTPAPVCGCYSLVSDASMATECPLGRNHWSSDFHFHDVDPGDLLVKICLTQPVGSQCIETSYVCDGTPDCPGGGQDEVACSPAPVINSNYVCLAAALPP